MHRRGLGARLPRCPGWKVIPESRCIGMHPSSRECTLGHLFPFTGMCVCVCVGGARVRVVRGHRVCAEVLKELKSHPACIRWRGYGDDIFINPGTFLPCMSLQGEGQMGDRHTHTRAHGKRDGRCIEKYTYIRHRVTVPCHGKDTASRGSNMPQSV